MWVCDEWRVAEGKSLAKSYSSKYMEVSAILNHKVDDLLVSTLKQIRLCSGGSGGRRLAENGQPSSLGDGAKPVDDDEFSSTTATTTAAATKRSRSPGLFSRLMRAASPRRTS